MTDKTLILDANELIHQFNIEDNDMDINAGSDEDEYMDEADAPIYHEDDQVLNLDGYDDLGNSEDLNIDGDNDLGNDEYENEEEEEEEEKEEEDDDDDDDYDKLYDPEYDDNIICQKRKRVRPAISSNTTLALERSNTRTRITNAEVFILEEDSNFLNTQTSRAPGTFGRQNRRKGERLPAYHKKVSAFLDSDDELMMQMREKGFSDRQIADKLAKDGRVRYDQKSISTRIMRIRLVQASNVDFLLKEGYKEWEFEDDCLLMQAYALADIEVSYEIERIRAWRFRKVSEYMRRLNKDALFSETACRERYNSLVEGTARIPTEIDDDPDARRAEMEAYRKAREEIRNKEQQEKEIKQAMERKAKNEAKEKNAQKAQETADRRAAKESEKAQRAMQRAAQAQLRAQRATENQQAKAQRNAQIKKQKAESERKKATKTKPNPKGKHNKNEGEDDDDDDNDAKPSIPKPSTSTKNITTDTPDPRSFLSLRDLSKMCADRGILVHGKTKLQLLDSVRDADEEWSAVELKKMCKSKGLSTSGCSKMKMRYQLALAAAQLFPSFDAGVAAAEEGME